MKIEFKNSIRRLSILWCISDIKIAWINSWSVEDCIKSVTLKSESVARLAREDLLGPVTSTIHKM